jgi:hypothetical protein
VSTLTLAPLTRDRVHGEPTLDDLMVGVWEGLSARRAVRCPVCAGELEPVQYAGEPVCGRCGECRATVS